MSGPSEDYDTDDEAALTAALEAALEDYDGNGEIRFMRITAEIEWAGEFARQPVRTVNFGPLDLADVVDALSAARKANTAAESAGSTFRAHGWEAQLKVLTKDPRGTAATDRAGLTVKRETLIKWLSGGGDPNPANQRRISTAYQDIRDQVVRQARDKSERANHQVAESVNRALEREYGAEIRVRRIEHIELSD